MRTPRIQGRTPNSEVEEFGVRPWNSVAGSTFPVEPAFFYFSS